MNQRRLRGVFRVLIVGALAAAFAFATPTASADETDGPQFGEEYYCNATDLSDYCRAQLLGQNPTPPVEPPGSNPGILANSCSVPEASFSQNGGFGVQRVKGHGYILCNHYNQALGISGVLVGEAAGGEFCSGENCVPYSVAGESFGQWACANDFVCLMSTQEGVGYGTRTCWSLDNHGVATSPYTGKPTKHAFKCYNF